MWKVFCQKTDKRTFYQKLENTNIGQRPTTGSIERTVIIDFKMCWLYMVLVLPGSVDTQLGWSGKFNNLFVEYSFLFPLVQKV